MARQMRTNADIWLPQIMPQKPICPKICPTITALHSGCKAGTCDRHLLKTLFIYTVFLFSNLINRGFNYQSGAPRGNLSPLRHRNWFHLVIMLSMCQRWTIFSQNLLLQNGFKMSQTDLLIVVFTLGILAFGYSIWFISSRILLSIFHRLTKNIWIGMV